MNKKTLYSFLFLLIVFSSVAFAQKKGDDGKKVAEPFKKGSVVKNYRGYMKASNFAKAKDELDGAMKKFDAARKDPQLYKFKVDALNGLVAAENKKIYLKQNPDTVKYFNYMYELYQTGLKCDTVERAANQEKVAEGKKAENKYGTSVAGIMMPYRKSIYAAGKYFYRKKEYAKAYQYIDLYVKTKTAPVFKDKNGEVKVDDPDDLTEASVLAVLSAYGSSNYKGVMAHLPESLNDKDKECQFLELGSKAAAEMKDTTEMVNLLENGFFLYPETEYFFVTLTKYYNDRGDFEKALATVQKMTEKNPGNRDYWFMCGKEQMLLGMYKEALVSFEKCVEIKADDAESFSAIGNIYLHDAHEKYRKFNLPVTHPAYAKEKAEITELYKKSCDAFEQSKKFDEQHTELWLLELRELYFKLNRGKSLKALDKYK